MKIFIIPGYGIPKNILKDESYRYYKKFVSKYILEFMSMHPRTKVVVIFTGGPTDTVFPYKRTEAREMSVLFKKVFEQAPNKIKVFLEQKSLSSLENQIYSKRIVDRIESKSKSIVLFAEMSRLPRIKKIAKIVFSKLDLVGVELPVNYQVADPGLVRKKEKVVMKYSLWALESPNNLREYRKIFVRKFKYLRQFPKDKENEAISKWWKEAILQVGEIKL